MAMKRHERSRAFAGALIGVLLSTALQGCDEETEVAEGKKHPVAEDAPPSEKAFVVGGCEGGAAPSGQCPTEFPTFQVSDEKSPTCQIAVVGAGSGGLYTALRLVDTNTYAGSDICVFEATSRVGGRLLSLRGLGPDGDLTVDAGGYRSWPEYTPVLHALITTYLGLNVTCYDEDVPCMKFNVCDEAGHKNGFASFVEHMMERLIAAGVRYFPMHKLISLQKASTDGDTTLSFSGGGTATATHSVILNIPQRPLLEVVRASSLPTDSVTEDTYHALHSSQTEIVTKLYLYYPNAWWRDLGLTSGDFAHEGDATQMPLKGRYHDGDVRCTEDGCHGFLLAAYVHDYSGESSMYFRRFQRDRSTPVTIVSSADPEGRVFLNHAHARLMEYHRDLPAEVFRGLPIAPVEFLQRLESVQDSSPTFAVLATWNIATDWAGGGWHQWTDLAYTDTAMSPLDSLGIYVVNEAFSKLQGWAEGTLRAADVVLQTHYGVSHPWTFEIGDLVQFVAQTKPVANCDDGVTAGGSSGGSSSSGSSGGDSVLCFGGDARLRLANGSTIALSSAQAGMEVWTGDGPGVVTQVLEHPVSRVLPVALLQTQEGELLAEPHHPVLVQGQWYEIADALSSNLLQETSPIIEDRFVDRLFNLEIDGHTVDGALHAYMVNGLVVSGLGDNITLNTRFQRQSAWKSRPPTRPALVV